MPLSDPKIAARFWAKVDKHPAGCWEWTASLSGGYGQFRSVSRRPDGSRGMSYAHRIAYEDAHGPIADGLHIDHLCRNRRCVNPDHMEPVTIRTNLLRGTGASARNAAKTACPSGHPYDKTDDRGKRVCTKCLQAYNVAYMREYQKTHPRRKSSTP